MILQVCDDYLEDTLLSLDSAAVGSGDPAQAPATPTTTNMFDFLVKEEPLGEDDLRALQKDRQKKDNHNMSKTRISCNLCSTDNTDSYIEGKILL